MKIGEFLFIRVKYIRIVFQNKAKKSIVLQFIDFYKTEIHINMDFRNWLTEYADYGFEEKESRNEKIDSSIDREIPIHRFDIEEMSTYLVMRQLGPHKPNARFVNEIVWGEEVGAMRVRINTDIGVMIDKKGVDLGGNIRWITKRSFQVNREGYGGYEDVVAGEIFEHVEEVYYQPNDVASSEFKGLERLVVGMAGKLERVAKDIFIFENITKVDDNRYIISFGVRGQGIEAPDHRRIEKNITEIIYSPKSGTIRVFNTNLESDVGGAHSWTIMPTNQDFYFFPSQDRDEIMEVISTPLKYY